MGTIWTLFARYKKLSILFVLATIAYLVQVLTSTPTQRELIRYHISVAKAHELGLTIAVPYIIIWFMGLVGYLRLQSYVKSLGDSKDGAAFRVLSQGVLILVLWLPLLVLMSGAASSQYDSHPSSTALLIRLINYVNIAILLAAFYVIYRGSKKLLAVVKRPSLGLTQRQAMLFVVFSVLYTFLTLHDVNRVHPTGYSTVATYYLSDWLIVLTVIIPRLMSWYLGAAAVANIFLYRQKVKGSIYRQALRHLAAGLGGVVLAVIVLRIVQSLSAAMAKLSLGLLLLLVYVLLIVIGVGYGYIAKGAKGLQKIEES